MGRKATRRNRGSLLDALLRLDDRAVALIAGDGVVLRANPAFDRLLGRAEAPRRIEALVGTATWDRISAARGGGTPLSIESPTGGPPRAVHLRWQHAGHGLVVVLAATPDPSGPGSEALADAERRIEVLEEQERVWRLAAHELANQLVAIRFATESLLAVPVSPRARQDLRSVLESAESASELLQRLQRATRPPAGATLVEVGEVVAEFAPLLERLLSRQVECLLPPEPRPPLLVRASRSQLEQLLANLALEIQDALWHGRLAIEVAAADLAEPVPPRLFGAPPGRYARVALRSEGPDRSFALRARLHAIPPIDPAAARLGAPLLRGIATEIGGDLAIDYAPELGTTITVFLPLVPPDPTP